MRLGLRNLLPSPLADNEVAIVGGQVVALAFRHVC